MVNSSARVHIDLGSQKSIDRIYYENWHESGDHTNDGVKAFTLWGSNDPAAFAELTYGIDAGWTQLTPSQNQFDRHVDADQADPKYITVLSAPTYRYVAFKFADNWGGATTLGVRRIVVQSRTAPGITGVTITSASAGSTFNWTSKDAAFNYADPAGFTVTIERAYLSNVGANVEWWLAPAIDQASLPGLTAKDRDAVIRSGIGEHLHALEISLEVYLAPDIDDAADKMREVIADVTTAIGVDVFWSGYAEDTSLIDESDLVIEERENCLVAVGLKFTIEFMTFPFNAYE